MTQPFCKLFLMPRMIILLSGFAALTGACGHKDPSPFSQSAQQALSTFTVPAGFKIELLASEPLINSPVDMTIDEYGRLYVVVMPGYPLDKSGSGRIVLLSDTDGDGKMDKSTPFAEGLVLPDGIMRWKKGILVTDAPNILYLEDTTGDGRSDIRDTVLTGFSLTNPQHNLNNPRYGLDNWIYVAHQGAVKTSHYAEAFGDEGSPVFFPGKPDGIHLPKNADGRCIRFQPDLYRLEMTASASQFGQTFDEWGHWFGCNNSNQGYQEVIANRYFERNPALPVSDADQSMSDHLDAPEVFPTTISPDRQLLTDAGVMTSGAGITAYLGSAFPAPFDQRITFITECVSNLVHADRLRDSGASFAAGRVLDNKEFLTSTDAWSRPVNLYIGPDGALYVLDYYRRVIESPEWMSEKAIAAGGLYDGADKGRIYRISPVDSRNPDWTKGLWLGKAGIQELADNLANPNAWWRMNAQRLLVDRRDTAAIPVVTGMVSGSPSPLGRLHALWTLEGMGVLSSGLIESALKDSVAGIRENAIRLAEIHLSASPGLEKPLRALQDDPDPKVRFQLLCTLGFVHTQEAAASRNKLLFTDINDPWVRIAALSAPPSETSSLLKTMLEKSPESNPAYASLVRLLTNMAGAGAGADTIHALIQNALAGGRLKAGWGAPVLEGIAKGMKNRKTPLVISGPDQESLVRTFFENGSGDLRRASLQVLAVHGIANESLKNASMAKAAILAANRQLPDEKRAENIRFIALGDPSPYVSLLEKMLVPQEEPVVRLAALHTLGQVPSDKVCSYLLQQWPVLNGELREAALDLLMTNPERTALLIAALEKGVVPIGQVSFDRSVGLMMQKDEGLRKRARTIFTKNEEEAAKINKDYQASLQMTGTPSKGRQVYLQNCAVCHTVRGKWGTALGPDLGTVHGWKKEDILANILNPSLSISAGYELWNAELNNGETVQGIIANETPAAITLKNFGKADRTINRQEIKSLKSLNVSAMTPGLEKKIDKQQMADLLAFLRQNEMGD